MTEAQTNNQTILLVDDDWITRPMVQAKPWNLGYKVRGAEDGRSAIELAAEHRPDHVLLDTTLPDMDSVEIAGQLGALPGGASVSVIILSSLHSKPPQAQWAELELAAFLRELVEHGSLFHGAEPAIFSEGRRQGEEQPAAKHSDKGPADPVRRVLVVYDDPIQLKLLKLQLEIVGYEVEVAVDGDDALNKARQFSPDAIVSDIIMPNLDGFGLCKQVRSDSRLAHIPVILVSAARTTPKDRLIAKGVGASALFPSTPSFSEVKQALAANLR